MGTTNQTLPFFTQFLRFKAQYSDLPLFVVANSAVAAYLVLSIPLSIVHSSGPGQVTVGRCNAGAGGGGRVGVGGDRAYLAYKGNVRTNWFAVCQQFDSFCERISGSLIGSFAAMAVLLLLVLLSAAALARR
uniref:CASP-like protein n=1 Tax=Oryza meridionalis TaxID=40149 RepID=A0A0E0CRE8_9ORYZ